MFGALAFVSVEEWNGYPLGSYLFAHLVAARRKVLASWSLESASGFEVVTFLLAASSDVAGASSIGVHFSRSSRWCIPAR